jgi:ferredoxin-NADP reductase
MASQQMTDQRRNDMAMVDVKLLRKETVANGTMLFEWEKPAGFEYVAGQFGDFTLVEPDETDAEGNVRGFSFVTAPFEEHLQTATRMRDTAFKRVLQRMPPGSTVKLDAPYGDFRLHKNSVTPAVFLIGGIGITPVRSIIAQATHDKTNHKITLLYSNRNPAQAAYLDELKHLAEVNKNFTFVPSFSDTDGFIDAKMVRAHVPDIGAPKYYLSGPEGMVKAMRKLLVDVGADEDNIKTEEFEGY